jgi:hypothetical protein
MGVWNSLLYILFPIPLTLVFLLSLPLPDFCRSTFRNIAIKISNIIFAKFSLPGGYTLSIFSCGMSVSTILCSITMYESISFGRKKGDAANAYQMTCTRWRAERNFWISLLSVLAWLMLWRLRLYVSENERLKKELRDQTKVN